MIPCSPIGTVYQSKMINLFAKVKEKAYEYLCILGGICLLVLGFLTFGYLEKKKIADIKKKSESDTKERLRKEEAYLREKIEESEKSSRIFIEETFQNRDDLQAKIEKIKSETKSREKDLSDLSLDQISKKIDNIGKKL